MTLTYFIYGAKEINYLKSRDPKLSLAIDSIGMINRPVNPDLFSALIKTIVGQQISTKAQATIWKRLQTCFQPFNPSALGQASIQEIQACGLSTRKATYIHQIALMVSEGKIHLSALKGLSDEMVCQELVKLPGVGPWTAEMLLIFSLQRPNIISYGDLAIRRGMRMLYRHKKITPTLFREYRERYSPYSTVASLYLWAIAGGALPELTDPAG